MISPLMISFPASLLQQFRWRSKGLAEGLVGVCQSSGSPTKTKVGRPKSDFQVPAIKTKQFVTFCYIMIILILLITKWSFHNFMIHSAGGENTIRIPLSTVWAQFEHSLNTVWALFSTVTVLKECLSCVQIVGELCSDVKEGENRH